MPPADRTLTLTPRQREVYAFLLRSVEERGFPPTIAEIAAHFGMKSPNAAAQHLRLMAQKGAIEVEPGKSRGLKLLGAAPRASAAPAARHAPAARGKEASLPIVGRVAAGSPILAEENRDGDVAVDPRAFASRPDYLLRVSGESMIDAGILPGDLVAVRRTPEARPGDIVVARIGAGSDSEVTVKRFERRGARVVLKPENRRMKPITVDLKEEAFALEGVVVGLLRLTGV